MLKNNLSQVFKVLILSFLFIFPAVSVAFFGDEIKKGNIEGSIEVDGRERTYLMYVPAAYDADRPWPLVIVLHGEGANARNAQRMTGFSAEADKKAFLVVYPNGTGPLPDRQLTWNAGNCCGYALERNIDDVAFIRALIEKLEKDYNIDRKAVYATGISNGGMLAYKLACELSGTIAAIGPVAGAMNVDTCMPMEPVSVIAFHGTEDKHVLYNGGWPQKYYDRFERKDRSTAYAMTYWAERDGCDPEPQKMESGRVRITSWTFGIDGAEVALYTIVGGGHAWPGGAEGLWGDPPDVGGISATDTIWEFFDRHQKK